MSEIEYLGLKVKCVDLEKENEKLKAKIKELQSTKSIGLEKHLVDLDKHIDRKLESLEIRNAEFKKEIANMLKQKLIKSPRYQEHILYDNGCIQEDYYSGDLRPSLLKIAMIHNFIKIYSRFSPNAFGEKKN